MTDPYTVTRDTHPDTPARWLSAYNRALTNGLMIRPGRLRSPLWVVTSGSQAGLAYATDGEVCGCAAFEHGDPVCQHRALYRAIHGTLPTQPNVISFRRPLTDDRPAA